MEALTLAPHEGVPNHPELSVRLYRAALSADAAAIEALFERHGWPPQWRDGVFDYHHYHTTAHEVLGCFAGRALLTLGGPGGAPVELNAGDAVLLPAGTGHRCDTASDDFAVVGAYPLGQEWDIVTAPADDAIRARIAAVPHPLLDPVSGEAFG